MSQLPNPQLAQQWRERLVRFDQSKLTIAGFCRLEGCSPASFYHWRRRLRTDQTGATLYSLVSSAARHHLDVWAYVDDCLRQLAAGSNDYESLLQDV